MALEILYLACNRLEFTRASLSALIENTDWQQVTSAVLYDDGSTDGTAALVDEIQLPVPTIRRHTRFASPVAVMNDYITTRHADLFCKLDNDTMVPPGWLGDCLSVMDRHPWLDLLGIEATRPVQPAPVTRSVEEAAYIGGIGLMRGRAFQYSLPRPDGRFGFTAWQDATKAARKGWLNPSLPVFLLDRMPIDPWLSLSKEYITHGWQRPWEPYAATDSRLWGWWQ